MHTHFLSVVLSAQNFDRPFTWDNQNMCRTTKNNALVVRQTTKDLTKCHFFSMLVCSNLTHLIIFFNLFLRIIVHKFTSSVTSSCFTLWQLTDNQKLPPEIGQPLIFFNSVTGCTDDRFNLVKFVHHVVVEMHKYSKWNYFIDLDRHWSYRLSQVIFWYFFNDFNSLCLYSA